MRTRSIPGTAKVNPVAVRVSVCPPPGVVMASEPAGAESVRLPVRFTLSPTVATLQAAVSLKVRFTEPSTATVPTVQPLNVAVRTPALHAE